MGALHASRLPISGRLLRCAELVPPCDTVADVGTDHGYLALQLLRAGTCRRVIASDLREKPLASARANAAAFGVEARSVERALRSAAPPAAPELSLLLSDGLHNYEPGSFDVLVLAGMGGDLMSRILAEAPWLAGGAYTLILQPQSAANELRRRLGEWGWAIRRECLVQDGGFLYGVMVVQPGEGRPLSPGEQYLSPALRQENDPLFPACLARVRRALELTVSGITRSSDPADARRAAYYIAALKELQEL